MKQKFKNPKTVFKKAVIGVLVLALVFCVAAANLLFSFALDRDSALGMEKMLMKQVTKGTSASSGSSQDYSGFAGTEQDKSWFGRTAKDVYVTSDDGLRLHGYLAENEKAEGKYVLVFHGYSSEASHMKAFMKRFYKMGYSVLAPDARAHGTSEGRIRGMGWLERKDALKWIDLLIQRDENCKIALFGVSMGGATVMMTSGEEALPKQVFACVEDCGYTSAWDEFSFQLKSMFRLPSFPILNLSSLVTKIRGGYGFKEASALSQVKKCRVPMLFIHGREDSFVPFSMLDELYNAAECSKRKLVVEGAGHAKSSSVDPDTYWGTVEGFLNQYLQKK